MHRCFQAAQLKIFFFDFSLQFMFDYDVLVHRRCAFIFLYSLPFSLSPSPSLSLPLSLPTRLDWILNLEFRCACKASVDSDRKVSCSPLSTSLFMFILYWIPLSVAFSAILSVVSTSIIKASLSRSEACCP